MIDKKYLNDETEALIAQQLSDAEPRISLSKAMVEPIVNQMDGILRKGLLEKIKNAKNTTPIYVITGETGEYDDWVRWNVMAFKNMDTCQNYRDLLNDILIQNNIPLQPNEPSLDPSPQFFKEFPDSELDGYWRNRGVEYRTGRINLFENISGKMNND